MTCVQTSCKRQHLLSCLHSVVLLHLHSHSRGAPALTGGDCSASLPVCSGQSYCSFSSTCRCALGSWPFPGSHHTQTQRLILKHHPAPSLFSPISHPTTVPLQLSAQPFWEHRCASGLGKVWWEEGSSWDLQRTCRKTKLSRSPVSGRACLQAAEEDAVSNGSLGEHHQKSEKFLLCSAALLLMLCWEQWRS